MFNIIFTEQDFVPTQKGRNNRFSEDQRLAESTGLIEKSAVAVYLDKYYEDHPKDNSYEGILARYTGLTKENVIAILDGIEGLEFLASYNPANYYPVPTSKFESKEAERVTLSSNSQGYIATTITLLPYYYIDEYRQRSFAI